MSLGEIIKALVGVLRYFLAPVTGTALVWLFVKDHALVGLMLQEMWPWGVSCYPWPIAIFLAAEGIVVYFVHRTLIHPLLTRAFVALVKWLLKSRGIWTVTHEPNIDELAFARWTRRGAKAETAMSSVQLAIDEASAASHFFYCSGLISILTCLVLRALLPGFAFSTDAWKFWATISAFFGCGLIGDWRTTRWDLMAYADCAGDAKHTTAADGV